jgi:hypothetical protein
MVESFINFELQIKLKMDEIRMLLGYLRNSQKNKSLAFRDFYLIEKILEIASQYKIELAKSGIVTEEELLFTNALIRNSVGIDGSTRYVDILNKVVSFF